MGAALDQSIVENQSHTRRTIKLLPVTSNLVFIKQKKRSHRCAQTNQSSLNMFSFQSPLSTYQSRCYRQKRRRGRRGTRSISRLRRRLTDNSTIDSKFGQQDEALITLRITDEEGIETCIETERSVRMHKIFDCESQYVRMSLCFIHQTSYTIYLATFIPAYARSKCIPTYYMIFVRNGVAIQPYQTPKMLDLEDGDLILEMNVGASGLFESLVALQLDEAKMQHEQRQWPPMME